MSYIIQKAIDRADMSAKAVAAVCLDDYQMQPKYDGCHAVFILIPGGTFRVLSSTGKEVKSCDHIAEALMKVLEVWEVTAICGEVWHPHWKFPEISGAFRRGYPQPDLMFAPYDIVRVLASGELSDPRPYIDRTAPLRDRRVWHTALVPFVSHSTDDHGPLPTEYALHMMKQGGYDGAILRHMTAPYKVGRCRNGEVIKVKPLVSYDLEVVGAELATGEKTGKNTAALVVRLPGKRTGKVATGLTQAEVDSIHADIGKWVGKIVRVDAMGWTEDGSLREPRYCGIRDDKVSPDF